MTLARWPHEPRRGAHSARTRRTRSPIDLEPLEGRTLLSLTLVKDINKVDVYPAQITGAGGKVYFTTRAADGGINLDVKTTAGTTVLKDFNSSANSGSYQSTIRNLTAAGSNVFFVAKTDASGAELWVTNGTSAGTKLVKDLNPGAASSYPLDLTAVGSKLFFTAANLPGQTSEGDGYTLLQTDGTAAHTTMVPGPAGTTGPVNASDLVSFAGKLYFTSGNQLMMTDGTTTTAVGTFPAPSTEQFGSPIADLAVVGQKLYFEAFDGNSPALYMTNGSVGGATVVKDFTAPTSSYGSLPSVLSSLTAVGSKLFFTANDKNTGTALWVSDGTSGGTKLLKALPAPSNMYVSLITSPTAVGSKLFFITQTPGSGPTGVNLWVSDGSSAGTAKIASISPSTSSQSNIGNGQLAAFNGSLFFVNADSAHGTELWKSNGTAAGTTLFKDIYAGAPSSFPINLTTTNGALYFGAVNGSGFSELWKSNGTAAGTGIVSQSKPNPNGGAFYGSGEDTFTVLGGSVIGMANDGIHGRELWKSNGTTAGTVMIKDLIPGPLSSNGFDFTTVGSKVFFVTFDGTSDQLWVTNGTAAGTTMLTTIAGNISGVRALNGKFVFLNNGDDSAPGASLWVSDGTKNGTTKVKSLGSASGYGSNALQLLNGKLYFVASASSEAPSTLWATDGTAGGTNPVVASPTFSNASHLAVSAKKIYFSAFSQTGPALWASDGTSGGTKQVSTLGGGASITTIKAAGSKVYIVVSAFNPASGQSTDLWASGGTEASTLKVHGFGNTFINSSQLIGLTNGKLLLAVSAGTSGSEANTYKPWVSDGTVAGTKLLKDMKVSFGYDSHSVINGLFYFGGTDATHGTELWRTDGTAAGTFMVQDLNPGKASSSPGAIASLGGRLLVIANDGVHGQEFFTSGNPAVAAPQVRTSVVAHELRISGLNSTLFPIVDYGTGSPAGGPGPVAIVTPTGGSSGDDGSVTLAGSHKKK